MLSVTIKLAQLESQQQLNITMAATVLYYESIIKQQHDLDLPSRAFWTANSVVAPHIVAALEYKYLKLRSTAKLWIRGFSSEVSLLAQRVRP